MSVASGRVEVVELRTGVQVFLQDEHALVFDDVPDLALGIEQVPELPGPHRADLDARRVPAGSVPDPLDAVGALLDHPDGARPVPEVVRLAAHLRGRQPRLPPVEVAG